MHRVPFDTSDRLTCETEKQCKADTKTETERQRERKRKYIGCSTQIKKAFWKWTEAKTRYQNRGKQNEREANRKKETGLKQQPKRLRRRGEKKKRVRKEKKKNWKK